jgi:hypothetical protein
MANDHGTIGKQIAWLLAGLAATCALALGAAVLFIPPRLESHQDQVAYALAQHGIAYQQITLMQTPRDTQYYSAYAGYEIYGADVIVQLADAPRVTGRIECRMKDSECKLYLANLGLLHERLPELDTGNQWFWLDWLRQLAPKLGLATQSSGARL